MIVCTTLSVVGLIIDIVADSLFATQIRPSGASAKVRGDVPTLIVVVTVFVTESITLTESLSGFTTHTLEELPPLLSTVIGVE